MKLVKVVFLTILLLTLTSCYIGDRNYTLSKTEITFEVGVTEPVYDITVTGDRTARYDCHIDDELVDYNKVGSYTAQCGFLGTEMIEFTVHIVDK